MFKDLLYTVNDFHFDTIKTSLKEDSFKVQVLIPGVDKNDIEASIEDSVLIVKTKEKGWFDKTTHKIDLSYYKVDTKDPSIELNNGVLTVEFKVKTHKKQLKIG